MDVHEQKHHREVDKCRNSISYSNYFIPNNYYQEVSSKLWDLSSFYWWTAFNRHGMINGLKITVYITWPFARYMVYVTISPYGVAPLVACIPPFPMHRFILFRIFCHLSYWSENRVYVVPCYCHWLPWTLFQRLYICQNEFAILNLVWLEIYL